MDSEQLRKLRMDIMEAQRDIDRARLEHKELLEKIEAAKNRIKEIEPLKERATGEYKNTIYELEGKEVKSTELDSNLEVLKKSEKRIIANLDEEIKGKVKKLNAFKQTKKDFIKGLDDREKDLNAKDYNYFTKLDILNQHERELTEREEKLKNGTESLTKNIGAIRHQEIQIKATQGQIDAKKRNTELSLTKALRLKAQIEAELAKQQEITKILINRGKIVDSREEILNKREDIIKNRRELIKKEKTELENIIKGFDDQKETKIIELRRLTNDAKAKLEEISNLKDSIETLNRDNVSISNHKKQIDTELKQRNNEKSNLESEINTSQAELSRVKREKTKIFEEIETETSKKSQDFERFAQGKKVLLQRIDEKEAEINRREARMNDRMETLNQEIKEERVLIAEDEAILEANKRKFYHQQNQLRIATAENEKQKEEVVRLLSETKRKKEQADVREKEQLELAREIGDKEAILNARLETLDKQKEFLDKRENQLNKDQAKLADDRRSLNRAWVARH